MTQINEVLGGFIGRRFTFTLRNRIWYSGVFRGIRSCDGQYGMVFTSIRVIRDEMPITIALIVHPSQTKCILVDGFVRLRSRCRDIFGKNGWDKHFQKTYVPKHRILNTKIGDVRGAI